MDGAISLATLRRTADALAQFKATAGQTWGGLDVIVTPLATKRVEDWSGVRSPGRARRRRKRGFRQNIVVTELPAAYQVAGKLIVHPDFWRSMKKKLARWEDDMATAAYRRADIWNGAARGLDF